MRYLVILTMSRSIPAGISSSYVCRIVTPKPGWTRFDLLEDAQAQMLPEIRDGGVVLFFSAEPLELEAEPR